MPTPEYMMVHHKYILKEIIDEYKFKNKITANRYIYIRIKRRMHGLT